MAKPFRSTTPLLPVDKGKREEKIYSECPILEINGYRLAAPEVDAVDIRLRFAAGEMDEKGLSGWLKANSGPFRARC